MIAGGYTKPESNAYVRAALANRDNRCANGFAPIQHPSLCACDPGDPFDRFVAILRENVRGDGTVHKNDVRKLTRGLAAPRKVSSMWRTAIGRGWIAEAGWERSNDVAGRNSHAPESYYAWLGTTPTTAAA